MKQYPQYLFKCGHKCHIHDAATGQANVKICPECGEKEAVKIFKCVICEKEFKMSKITANRKYCGGECRKTGNIRKAEKSQRNRRLGITETKLSAMKRRKIHNDHLSASTKRWDCAHREHCLDALGDGRHIPCCGCKDYINYRDYVTTKKESIVMNRNFTNQTQFPCTQSIGGGSLITHA